MRIYVQIYTYTCTHKHEYHTCKYICIHAHTHIYKPGVETVLVLLMPGTTNNSVNVIQNGLKIIH